MTTAIRLTGQAHRMSVTVRPTRLFGAVMVIADSVSRSDRYWQAAEDRASTARRKRQSGTARIGREPDDRLRVMGATRGTTTTRLACFWRGAVTISAL